MSSSKQMVDNAPPASFEMDRRQSTSQQKSVPTEPDTNPVAIELGTEGEQENKSPRKYLSGWKLWLLTIGYVKLGIYIFFHEQGRQQTHCTVFGLPSFSPPSRPPLSVPRWFRSPTP
jgi:hypothetical protein